MAVRAAALAPALVACAALLLWRSVPPVAQETGWPDAVDRVAREKALAESCASILKTFGDHAPMARVQGERLYARAKADADGLITLLIVDVAGERSPVEIPELRQRLEAVLEQRRALCRHVDAAIGTAVRQLPERTHAADLLAEGTADAANSAIDATVQIWQAYRRADQVGREAIIAAIEGTRWLPYAAVPAS